MSSNLGELKLTFFLLNIILAWRWKGGRNPS